MGKIQSARRICLMAALLLAAALLLIMPKMAYADESFDGWCGHTVSTYDHAGADRYGTNVAAVNATYSGGADSVILASGENFPDALCGSTLSGMADAPIVLVGRSSVAPATAKLIADLKPTKLIVLGGKGAIGDEVLTAVKQAAPTIAKVDRLGGADRYETNCKIWNYMTADYGAAFTGELIVATGTNFPDALAVSTYAAAKQVPIVLASRPTTIPETTRALVKSFAGDVVICGGTGVIAESTADWFTGHGAKVTRLGGGDRYATSKLIAEYGIAHGMDGAKMIVADGRNFPDALSASCMGKPAMAPILLGDGGSASAATGYTGASKTRIDRVHYLGGQSAVPSSTKIAVRHILENAADGNGKVWHEPVYQSQWVGNNVWVVDSAAWDEVVDTGEGYIQCSCGQQFSSYDAWVEHDDDQTGHGHSYSVKPIYSTVHHDEVGHWEKQGRWTRVLISEGYWS